MASFFGRDAQGVTHTGVIVPTRVVPFICRCRDDNWPTLAVAGEGRILGGIREGHIYFRRQR